MKFARTCLLFDLHKADDFVLDNLAAVRAAADGLFDVVCTVHGTKAPEGVTGASICLSDQDIFGAYPHHKGSRIIPGNMDMKMIAAAERLDGYDSFIRFEYDVWPIGDLRESLETLGAISETCDLGSSFIQKKPGKSDWIWFASVAAPDGEDLGGRALDDLLYGSFLPLAIYSRIFLEAYRERLLRGWVGHEEALTPTLAHLEGMRVTNISAEPYHLTARANFGVQKIEAVAEGQGRFLHPLKTALDRERLTPAFTA